MFQKLVAAIESANFKNAVRQGRLACPACGTAPEVASPAADDVITCAHCGTVASALECSSKASATALIGNSDEPPAETKITRQTEASGAISWNIPATGKSGGLMFFALFWCGITAVVSGGFLFGKPSEEGGLAAWFPVLFFGVFWAVGLGVLYMALRSKYAKHRLTADSRAITLRRELFGKTTETRLPAGSVESIAAVQFYQRNYQPVHGIEIRSPQGKLRFGSMLSEPEKAWLIADLKRVILGSAASQEEPASAPAPASTGHDGYFSVLLPRSTRWMLGVGFMLAVMGVAFILVGVFLIDRWVPGLHRSTPGAGGIEGPFDYFISSFRVIWIGGSSIFAAIGIALLVRYFRTRHHETRLEGTSQEVAFRTTNAGRIVHQRIYPRSEVRDIRSSTVGNTNGKPAKRIELLVGPKAHSLSRWTDGEKADAFIAEVRKALFPPSPRR